METKKTLFPMSWPWSGNHLSLKNLVFWIQGGLITKRKLGDFNFLQSSSPNGLVIGNVYNLWRKCTLFTASIAVLQFFFFFPVKHARQLNFGNRISPKIDFYFIFFPNLQWTVGTIGFNATANPFGAVFFNLWCCTSCIYAEL